MKIKIISEGDSLGTVVVNAETGERIEGVSSIKWEVAAHPHQFATATLQFVNVPVEVIGEVKSQ